MALGLAMHIQTSQADLMRGAEIWTAFIGVFFQLLLLASIICISESQLHSG